MLASILPLQSTAPDLFSGCRYAFRTLRKNPGFALPAIIALALGIGATTAIFTAVHALLLRPLPYRDSGRLVLVGDRLTKLDLNQFPVSFGNYLDYRDHNEVFEGVAAFQYADMHLTAAPDAAAIPSASRVGRAPGHPRRSRGHAAHGVKRAPL